MLEVGGLVKLWFIMGTAAELIKMFPVIQEAEQRGLSWWVWSTGQGSTNFWMQYDDLQLPRDRAFCLDEKASDLHSSYQAAIWMLRNFFRSKTSLLQGIEFKTSSRLNSGDLAVVHGDTFSTFLGARYAKRLNMKLAHVEAGMRSGDIFSPFPEEINRRLVSRWADFHFAPDEAAEMHLLREKQRGKIYVTGGNSVYDAMVSTLRLPRPKDIPSGDYILANLHRFENLQSADAWKILIESLIDAQKSAPVYFVMHPPTEARLKQDPVSIERLNSAGVQLLGRQSYTRFVHLLAGAKFVLTDGGSNQTECAYLGMPCLILRKKTELQDGIGNNCVLSRFDKSIIDNFLLNPNVFKRPMLKLNQSPSQKIMQAIVAETKVET